MKLVADANTKEGELPAAESCGLDEEDEDEQFDSVKFNEGKGRKFFSRLKMGSKRVSLFTFTLENLIRQRCKFVLCKLHQSF